MKLKEIAHSRTGDKGDISTISVIAYDMDDYEFIKQKITNEKVAKWLSDFIKGEVKRYELPKLGAINFVLTNSLSGGDTRSLSIDAHGKSLSSLLLDMEI